MHRNNNDDDSDDDPKIKFQYQSVEEISEESSKMKNNFCALVDNIDTLDPKIKVLWKEIYRNAVDDRSKAFLAWADLYKSMDGKSDEHFKNGQILSKYLERLEKSNAQLLKLAELVNQFVINESKNDEEEEEKVPSADEIYKMSATKYKQ